MATTLTTMVVFFLRLSLNDLFYNSELPYLQGSQKATRNDLITRKAEFRRNDHHVRLYEIR